VSPRRTAAGAIRRAPLTRERVLAAALELIDEGGLDGFSMRRLAARLGVDPMAIYYHLPNKAAVLDGVVEAIMAGYRVPPVAGPVEERWRAAARAYRDLLRAHPKALPIVASWPMRSEGSWRVLESLLALIREAGVDHPQAMATVQFVGALINGLVLAEVGLPPGGVPDRTPAEKRAPMDALSPENFPHIATALGAGGAPDFDRTFDLALDVIAHGLRAVSAGAADVRSCDTRGDPPG